MSLSSISVSTLCSACIFDLGYSRAERYNLIVYIHNQKHARDEKHGE